MRSLWINFLYLKFRTCTSYLIIINLVGQINVPSSDGHKVDYPKPKRSRTAWNHPGIGTVHDRFRTGPNRRTVKPHGKSCRSRETAGKTAWTGPPFLRNGPGTEPNRFTRPNDSVEPDPKPPDPAVLWMKMNQ